MDLNADVGEWSGSEPSGEVALIQVVTTVHVACGFHAGGPEVMRRTVAAAAAAGVTVGAHPSYPDREGFGRRPMDRPVELVVEDVLAQLGALDTIARNEGVRMTSVKPHGALYNRMARDDSCSEAVAMAIRSFDDRLKMVLLAGSPAISAAAKTGVRVVPEAFCDRGYEPDGSLTTRGTPGSIVTDPNEAARRAVLLATQGIVIAVDGTRLELDADTLCIHSDTPDARDVAVAVRAALEDSGVGVGAPVE
jgi:UPF0271 protein